MYFIWPRSCHPYNACPPGLLALHCWYSAHPWTFLCHLPVQKQNKSMLHGTGCLCLCGQQWQHNASAAQCPLTHTHPLYHGQSAHHSRLAAGQLSTALHMHVSSAGEGTCLPAAEAQLSNSVHSTWCSMTMRQLCRPPCDLQRYTGHVCTLCAQRSIDALISVCTTTTSCMGAAEVNRDVVLDTYHADICRL